MSLSLFDLFKIGIGPSSSHTVGPMVAARRFLDALDRDGRFSAVAGITVEIYGSLALTGRGHATDTAIILGLAGETPDGVDPDLIAGLVEGVRQSLRLAALGRRLISFDPDTDLVWRRKDTLPHHTNGMTFIARDAGGAEIARDSFYSIGGGFVISATEADAAAGDAPVHGDRGALPLPFSSAAELLALTRHHQIDIAGIVRRNEHALWGAPETARRLAAIKAAMLGAVDRGLATDGPLPGRLTRRRAADLARRLTERAGANALPALDGFERLSAYAIAVNEENAAGGRIVTAPTNGAAGIIPAVLAWLLRHSGIGGDERGREAAADTMLFTAAAIGMLYKLNASISGAEVGCQGEVGVASSMAAGGLAAAMGASPAQVENAAEIAMEHHLGMTCDPVGGLVQIPCIERNAMGAVKAVNAALLALAGDGSHVVSLDTVIRTMKETSHDMQSKYKETSLGGLAVNVPVC
ncbi:L-serine dehydratase [Tistrella bauzanensis]|uniref:L-serine dehydratase n=1 Tax=Tistrella bauzanensis TaxID=657419 RepID=A0ABQ1IN44_9PROT|nr:L-serine ammonia-lyase [Tistrella bauzanensis]GGB45609.1 L-serine dehydratase [Tistrella bauzanensis]